MESNAQTNILLPYQQRWVDDDAPLKIWLASRQIGKSFAVAIEAVGLALRSRCDNLILSSSERQSKEVMRKVYKHLRVLKVASKKVIKAEAQTREEVRLPNGSRIVSLPANPDTVRGFSGNVFLDEFAFHRDSLEIWKAMYPTVTRGYKIRITSTPNGKSDMFYRLWARNERFSKHRTDINDAKADGLEADVDELRLGIDDPEAWAQEFECRFIDESTALITYEMISSCEDDSASKVFLSQGDAQGGRSPLCDFYLGVDIGRKRDLTVFWLWQKEGEVFRTVMVHEMRNATFREQRAFLYSLLDGGSIHRACIDSTGIGAQLSEEAVERFGHRVEAVVFTQRVKESLAFTMKRKFEERLLSIPIDKDIREDFHSVRRMTTEAGNARFDADRTEAGHADRFWAAALGVHAGSSKPVTVEYESIEQRGLRRGMSW